MDEGCARLEARFDQVLANLPKRPLAWLMRALVLPVRLNRGASDALTRDCADLLLSPSPTRDRLIANLQRGEGDDVLAQLERAFGLVNAVQPLHDKLKREGVRDWREAHRAGAITDDQARQIEAAENAVRKVVAVDDFAPGAFVRPVD